MQDNMKKTKFPKGFLKSKDFASPQETSCSIKNEQRAEDTTSCVSNKKNFMSAFLSLGVCLLALR